MPGLDVASTSLLSRHTVLMLARSPACPQLTAKQPSTALQKAYDSMVPLLEQAGLAHSDLGSAWNDPKTNGVPIERQAWGCRAPSRSYPRPWVNEGTLPKQVAEQSVPGASDVLERHNYTIDYSQSAASNEAPPPYVDAEWIPIGLRRPAIGDIVSPSSGVFSCIVQVEPGTEKGNEVVLVAPFRGQQSFPFNCPASQSVPLRRKDLLLDPRGYWRHAHALRQDRAQQQCSLFTSLWHPHKGLKRSGMAGDCSVPNDPIHEVGGLPRKDKIASKCDVFSAEGSWNAAFVVAPQGMVMQQNQKADRGGRPSRILWRQLMEPNISVKHSASTLTMSSSAFELARVPTSMTAPVVAPPNWKYEGRQLVVERGEGQCSESTGDGRARARTAANRLQARRDAHTDAWEKLQREMGTLKALNRGLKKFPVSPNFQEELKAIRLKFGLIASGEPEPSSYGANHSDADVFALTKVDAPEAEDDAEESSPIVATPLERERAHRREAKRSASLQSLLSGVSSGPGNVSPNHPSYPGAGQALRAKTKRLRPPATWHELRGSGACGGGFQYLLDHTNGSAFLDTRGASVRGSARSGVKRDGRHPSYTRVSKCSESSTFCDASKALDAIQGRRSREAEARASLMIFPMKHAEGAKYMRREPSGSRLGPQSAFSISSFPNEKERAYGGSRLLKSRPQTRGITTPCVTPPRIPVANIEVISLKRDDQLSINEGMAITGW
ncbi:unnamed protein product [Chrysoparadoxa australica]